MYAIVDIETTGGHASANGITEIAVLLHDGDEVVYQYHTLVNPQVPVPLYISALTGIHDAMLSDAPLFSDIAPQLYELIYDKVFVAHNVNFDYSFLKHHLSLCGFDLQCKKLCTVRLGRKIFPGLPSYSLGKLCYRFNIENDSRHRAPGDARATAIFFSLLLKNDPEGYINQALSRKSGEQQLPPNLSKADVDLLPSIPGVYYFKDHRGRVIYVGKAVDIKKRVISHFTGNNPGRQRQEFLRNIYSVSHEACGTELIAFILEAIEIKRLWPSNNRALKRYDQVYGLYKFEDQKGYDRLLIDKRKRNSMPLISFNSLTEARNALISLIREFQLCPKLCFIQTNREVCNGISADYCKGACEGKEPPDKYNLRVTQALSELKTRLPSFLLVDKGRDDGEKSVILVENGVLYGMGYLSDNNSFTDIDFIKPLLSPCTPNEYITNLVLSYALKFPGKVYRKELV